MHVEMITVSDLKEGNADSFKQVYFRYHEKLYSFIYQRTSSHYLAEEVVQQAFIRFWERRELLSEEVSISTQLFQIAKTIMIDELRKEAVKRSHYNDIVADVNVSTEENRIVHKDRLEQVVKAIDTMPPIRRIIFKMSRQEHLSHIEIAKQLSISPKTVENHISRAIKQLRQAIHLFMF